MEEETPSGYFSELALFGLLDTDTLNEIAKKTAGAADDENDINTPVVTEMQIDKITLKFSHLPRKGLSFQIWPSAILLAKYFAFQVNHCNLNLRTSTILELGSGTGFLGAFIALLGGNSIVTDLGKTVDNMRATLMLNNIPSSSLQLAQPSIGGIACAEELDWCRPPTKDQVVSWFNRFYSDDPSHAPFKGVDIICATDCVYERTLHDDLLATLLLLCDITTQVYFANVKRFKADHKFWKKLSHRFLVEEIDPTPFLSNELSLSAPSATSNPPPADSASESIPSPACGEDPTLLPSSTNTPQQQRLNKKRGSIILYRCRLRK